MTNQEHLNRAVGCGEAVAERITVDVGIATVIRKRASASLSRAENM